MHDLLNRLYDKEKCQRLGFLGPKTVNFLMLKLVLEKEEKGQEKNTQKKVGYGLS